MTMAIYNTRELIKFTKGDTETIYVNFVNDVENAIKPLINLLINNNVENTSIELNLPITLTIEKINKNNYHVLVRVNDKAETEMKNLKYDTPSTECYKVIPEKEKERDVFENYIHWL